MAAPLGKYVMFHFDGSAHMVVTLLVKAGDPNKSCLKSSRHFLLQCADHLISIRSVEIGIEY